MKKAFVVTAAAFLAVLLVVGFLIFSGRSSPHDVVLKHVPDEWQLVTITRPAAVDESPAATEAQVARAVRRSGRSPSRTRSR